MKSEEDAAPTASNLAHEQLATDEQLFKVLSDNYSCLRRCCRLGRFEGNVKWVKEWCTSDGTGFRAFQAEGDVGSPTPFRKAVENCYELLQYLRTREANIEKDGILFLRVKNVIYEAKDYWLSVPANLGDELVQRAEGFAAAGLGAEAEKLNGGSFADQDERTHVIKDLIIAALFGANELYRRHNASSYASARKILTGICRYIDSELPGLHQDKRPSYGLEGLAHYLMGRILSAQGSFNDARNEFRMSAEAYGARLRQKEQFLKQNKITKPVFQEKRAVTLRRLALVSAFGEAYVSFVRSRITRALETLTLARAVLAQDTGHLYLLYVDVLYWACKRAIYSSDEVRLDEIIENMTACRADICLVLRDSHYSHRAGLELSLSLYYRAKIAYQHGDLRASDEYYNRGIELLNSTIKFSKDHHNSHLQADALIIRSHFFRVKYRVNSRRFPSDDARLLSILHKALQDAEEAVGLSASLPGLASDAFLSRGTVETMLAQFHSDGEEFRRQYNKARGSFHLALNRNQQENLRVEAEAHLRLAKLYLLDKHSQLFAWGHFKTWEEMKGRVEHQYCHEIARKLWSQMQAEGPTLVITAGDNLHHDVLNERVKRFSIDATLNELVIQHAGKSVDYDDATWKDLLKKALHDKLGYKTTQVYSLINDLGLIEQIKELRGPLPSD